MQRSFWLAVLSVTLLASARAAADQPRLQLGISGGMGVVFAAQWMESSSHLPPLSAGVYLRADRFGLVAERMGAGPDSAVMRDLLLEYYLPLYEARPVWHPGRPQFGLRLKTGRAWFELPYQRPDRIGTTVGLALSIRRPGEAGPRLSLPFEVQVELRATRVWGEPGSSTSGIGSGLGTVGAGSSSAIDHHMVAGRSGSTLWMLLYTLSFGLGWG